MIDDTSALPAVWMSDESTRNGELASAIDAVLNADRAARERENRIRHGSLLALICLLPPLLWFAAHGVTPVVRGAYALMAAGAAVVLYAEWMYLDWSRQALPGPDDARSQLQKTAFMLARQIELLRTAPFWTSPVFVGVALIGFWLYGARSHSGAFVLWTLTAAGWLVMSLGMASVGARLGKTRLEVERLLREL